MQKEKQQAADKEKEENREKRLRELVPARRCRHFRVAFTSDRKLEAHEEKCTPKPVGPAVNALRDTAASYKPHLEQAAAADSAHRTELGKLQHVFKTATDLQAWQADPRCNRAAQRRDHHRHFRAQAARGPPRVRAAWARQRRATPNGRLAPLGRAAVAEALRGLGNLCALHAGGPRKAAGIPGLP
jgi:hypothetical protein